MTDEKFLRGCIGFFLYPVTSVFLSLGLVCGLFALLYQDLGACLTSLILLSISVGLKRAFSIPSVWNSEPDNGEIERYTECEIIEQQGMRDFKENAE